MLGEQNIDKLGIPFCQNSRMDNNAINNSGSDKPLKAVQLQTGNNISSEMVTVKKELTRSIHRMAEQEAELEMAKEKIYMQDQQLEEAAQILKLQLNALKSSEAERKAVEVKLNNEKQEKQKLAAKCQKLENVVNHVSDEVANLLQLVADVSKEVQNSHVSLQEKLETLSTSLRNNVIERLEYQKRMKSEIAVLRKTVEEMQILLESKSPEKPPMPISNVKEIKVPLQMLPVVKVEKLNLSSLIRGKLPLNKESVKTEEKSKMKYNLRNKWVPCNQCDKNFLGNWALAKHQRKHHRNRDESSTDIEECYCNQCGFAHKSRESLRKHERKCCIPDVGIAAPELVEVRLDAQNISEDEDDVAYENRMSNLLGKCIFVKLHTNDH